MYSQNRYLTFIATCLAVLAGGCAAQSSEPVAAARQPLSCPGGILRSEADAASYSSCATVTGDLRIQHSTLTDLDALGSLRRISGRLEISNNAELDDLGGLGNLKSAGSVSIRNNPALETLKGLEGLEQTRSVTIEHNGIYDTVGLAQLAEVGALVVKDNPRLISLGGFKSLKRAQSVEIRNNPRVAAYYGILPELQQVDGELVLRHNAGLSNSDVRGVVERVERLPHQPTVVAREDQREAMRH